MTNRSDLLSSWLLRVLTVFAAFVLGTVLPSAGVGLKLTSMDVPAVADPRGDATLECQFDMGGEELYAVKWYKDDQEFFRYSPGQNPVITTFPVEGVRLVPSLTDCGVDHCRVILRQPSREHGAGVYRCEVSSEAPAFRLASETRKIVIAAITKEPPRLEGLRSSYTEGDILAARCTSDSSDPPATLSWFINGKPVPHTAVTLPETNEPSADGLVARSIILTLTLDRQMAASDTLEICCESRLPGVPLPRQATVHRAQIKSREEAQLISNQKLHWYSFNAGASYFHFHIIWLVSVAAIILR